MRTVTLILLLAAATAYPPAVSANDRDVVAVIGTGDMGDSLGPKLADLGFRVVYGSRDPNRDSVRSLIGKTGAGASATTQREAAQAAGIVLLAVPWPAMEEVAQSLGNLNGKIVIDVSFPYEQAEDGYPRMTVETSSAELIQQWNPGAQVVKWSLPTAHYIDKPMALGRRPTNWIAADDRAAKETIARIAHEMGQDPIDAGPLRMSRGLEAQVLIFMVPLYQRRPQNWESTATRSSYWACNWGDDWSEPVADSDDLAAFPVSGPPPQPCAAYRDER